jgi:hypothetical protein
MIALLIGAVVYCQPNGYCRSQPYPTPPILEEVQQPRPIIKRPAHRKTEEQINIESDIIAFCSSHPDESFCMRLENYLRTHPWADPRVHH